MEMKRKLAYLTAILAAIVTLIFTGCPDGETPEESGPISYNVYISATIENGIITSDTSTASQGDLVTLGIIPYDGYRLKEGSLTVKQSNGTAVPINGSGDTYTFTMPASNVTVSGEFELEQYNITVQAGIENGSISASPVISIAGEVITLTITPINEGYILRESTLSVKQTDGTTVLISGSGETRTFIMPASDVTVSGAFGIRYYIKVQEGMVNGSISANPTSSAAEEAITLTITPIRLYKLKELSVKQADGTTTVQTSGSGRTRTFTMPAFNVTVSGEFEEIGPEVDNNNIIIHFEGFHEEEIDLTRDHNNDLVMGSGQTLYMEVPAGYDKYYWIVNGESWSGLNFFEVTMDADIWGANSIGVHTITVVVQKGALSYSKSVTFRVVL